MLRSRGKLCGRDGRKNMLMLDSANAGFDLYDDTEDNDRRLNGVADASDYIVDIREYDVPYHVRVAIDRGKYLFRPGILSV